MVTYRANQKALQTARVQTYLQDLTMQQQAAIKRAVREQLIELEITL